MRIAICGSLNFAGEINKIEKELVSGGHEPLLPASIKDFLLENSNDADKLKADRKRYMEIKQVYLKEHFKKIENSDAILVVNLKKHDIKNYIGGNTFAEIMFAFYLDKRIFFLNPIPTEPKVFADELESVKPVVLNGNLELIS